MTELSPAAQAVMDAMYEVNVNFCDENHTLAVAALRAAADQVVPEHKPWNRTGERGSTMHDVRLELLAIAAELEGQANA